MASYRLLVIIAIVAGALALANGFPSEVPYSRVPRGAPPTKDLQGAESWGYGWGGYGGGWGGWGYGGYGGYGGYYAGYYPSWGGYYGWW